MVRPGRLKNARRGDVRCGIFEEMMSSCKGFAGDSEGEGRWEWTGIDVCSLENIEKND